MKTTIDKAGRVVIPAQVRRNLGFEAGIELDVVVEDFTVRLVRAVPRPKLERVGALIVARPMAPLNHRMPVDVAALVREERDRWP